MLNQLLHEFETAAEPVNLNDLARRLSVEQSALEGMIQFWVRKGRISDSKTGVKVSCAASCPGADSCPFTAKLPRQFTLNEEAF